MEFVPSNKAYAPVVVPGWQTVTVEAAVWTDDDVNIVGTTVEQLDGKAYALTSFSYTPKFESDRSYLKVTYSADGGKTWVEDITKATRTTSGLVQIKIVDTRDPKMYEDKTFLGSIKLGNSKVSTLALADTTAVYTDDGSKLAPQMVIKTEGVADIKVPASDLKYEYATYTDNKLAAAYIDATNLTLGDLHYAEKPYWVRASIKATALSKYGDYNFGDNASLTAYATYTVEKLKLDETKLSDTINTAVKLTTTYENDTTYVGGAS